MQLFKQLFQRKAPASDATVADLTAKLEQAKQVADAGNLESAYTLCRDVQRLAPGHLAMLELAFELGLKQPARTETLDWMRAALPLHPGSASLHFMLGRLCFARQDFEAAAALFRQAIALDSAHAKAHNTLGASLQMLGRLEEAMAHFQQAERLDPTLWTASYNVGNLYKLSGRLDLAVEPFQRSMRARREVAAEVELDEEFFRTSRSKLRHDIEQLSYLAAHREDGEHEENIQRAMAGLNRLEEEMQPYFSSHHAEIPAQLKPLAAPYYNRLVNFCDAPALPGGAINRDQDWAAIEAAYFANGPGVTYIDNFLKPEALASLRRFCLESTIWFDYAYQGGYVGCTCEDGFICPLLAQIAEEFRLAMPGVIGEHRINGLWGYKYDSAMSGISVHADFAAVNVNFWITPDEASLDPARGGLVVWDKEAPLDWDFDDYNNNGKRINGFLQQSGAQPVVIPHRQNRVAIFNSDLFHRTDDYRFMEGYENRRINITMLYGDRRTA